MEEYLKQLNESQREAVVYTDGPSLVVAGAGSGKTRVLTYKIAYLLQQGLPPQSILALTFTNKAAREMKERIASLTDGQTARRLWMGTFHSIFSRILRYEAERIGYPSNFTIYDAADSKSLLRSIMKEMQLDDKLYRPGMVQSRISNAKNALITYKAYEQNKELVQHDIDSKIPLLREIYKRYQSRCLQAGAMDFDDLLLQTNILFRDHPDVLEKYRNFFQFVLVDEYQDTNFAQHVIVSQLCEQSHKLCVVGDDAQSIYSFRGANISNILNLKKAYPELRTFKLEQNYRSTQNIINAANSLIAKNTQQIHKEVFSRNEPGALPEVVRSYSDFEEGYLVANRIAQIKIHTRDSYDDFAILYRTNAQSRVLEESLRKRNIPYRIYGGLSFYQRKEIKDAIAYFRLTVNPADEEALKRIINFPARGIGETTVNKLLRCATDNRTSVWSILNDLQLYNPGVNSGTARKLEAFRSLIQGFIDFNATHSAHEVACRIYSDTGILSMLKTDRTPESISKQENLQELINGVREFMTDRLEEGNDKVTLSDFLGEISLATDQDSDSESEGGERVTMMTVHAAKGLEFNNVFIVGLEEDLFPSALSSNSLSEIEEERRLLYVAITRAKKFCMMSYAGSRYRNGMTTLCKPSRFLADIDPRYLADKTSGSSGLPRPSFSSYRQSYHSEPLRPSRSSGAAIPKPRTLPPTLSPTASAPAPVTTHTGGSYTTYSANDLTEGMTIEHPRFGRGKIDTIDRSQADARIRVTFENTDPRTLLLKFAKIKIIAQS